MIVYIFVRRDKKGKVNEGLTNFIAEAPPQVGDYLNIYLQDKQCSSNYLVEWVYWRITDKENKGLLTVEVHCKEIGWSDKL